MIPCSNPTVSSLLSLGCFILIIIISIIIECDFTGALELTGSTDPDGDRSTAHGHSKRVVESRNEPTRPNKERQMVHFEDIQDLEHISYLSLRNFNMTDEALLQSSLSLGLAGSTIARKHNQEEGAVERDNLVADGGDNSREQLAIMLESFILRLRNGRMKRLTLEELEFIASSLNNQLGQVVPPEMSYVPTPKELDNELVSNGTNWDQANFSPESFKRCYYLVAIYQAEMRRRFVSANRGLFLQSNQEDGQTLADNATSGIERESDPNEPSDRAQSMSSGRPVSQDKLMGLCRLVVQCQTGEELVGLIGSDGGWWKPPMRQDETESGRVESETDQSWIGHKESSSKSLRDTVSSSLAKLCPLMLFQLHEEEGLCNIRRDDRPSSVAVWGFASLFVTIVSFCSLIGLSITPLISHSPTQESSGTSDEASVAKQHGHKSSNLGPAHEWADQDGGGKARHTHRHRSCLTLFEGLAVGSLVGSALFSLIPQAFELQEHESNQGFLLKALIIFLGIYLFFCSERIMRIILDTRRKRKKKKHLLNKHRGSNSLANPSTTLDNEQFQQVSTGFDLQRARLADHRLNPMDYHLDQVYSWPQHQYQQQAQQQQQQQQQQLGQNGSQLMGRRRQVADGPQTYRGAELHEVVKPTNRWSQLGSVKSQQFADNRVATEWRTSAPIQHIEITNRGVTGERSQRGVNFSPGVSEGVGSAKIRRQQDRKSAGRERTHRRRKQQERRPGEKSESGHLTGNLDDQQTTAGPGKQSNQQVMSVAKCERRNLRRKIRQQQLIAANRRLGRRQARQQLQLKALVQRDVYLHPCNNQSTSTGAELADVSSKRKRHLCCELSSSVSTSPSDEPQMDRNHRLRQLEGDMMQRFRESRVHLSSGSSGDEQPDKRLEEKQHFSFPPTNGSRSSKRSSSSSSSCTWSDCDNEMGQLNLRQQRAVSMQLNSSSSQSRTHQQPVGASRRRLDNAVGQMEPHREKHKREISTVAWMIILGDGLHNFIDGISIGAAFSESILSGVSISVAVICEEFPHELGDFAVLVSSGMTVRQALGYNFISACTCYLGMGVGIILGDVNDSASYISALAAGVFLYIALVDMMGELSATLEETSRNSIAKTLKLMFLQNVGIFIGISIIFVLSFIDF